ncbi:MAG: hypothetical protein QMD23_05915 [Candidatus Bathyarchaeia archaeon]|nr:hypothetical protein [Candidatus Bathyarchaeia archaeon]
MGEIEFSCWCCAVQRQVCVKGRVVGRWQADLLRVLDCEEKLCGMRGSESCLVGNLREDYSYTASSSGQLEP